MRALKKAVRDVWSLPKVLTCLVTYLCTSLLAVWYTVNTAVHTYPPDYTVDWYWVRMRDAIDGAAVIALVLCCFFLFATAFIDQINKGNADYLYALPMNRTAYVGWKTALAVLLPVILYELTILIDTLCIPVHFDRNIEVITAGMYCFPIAGLLMVINTCTHTATQRAIGYAAGFAATGVGTWLLFGSTFGIYSDVIICVIAFSVGILLTKWQCAEKVKA